MLALLFTAYSYPLLIYPESFLTDVCVLTCYLFLCGMSISLFLCFCVICSFVVSVCVLTCNLTYYLKTFPSLWLQPLDWDPFLLDREGGNTFSQNLCPVCGLAGTSAFWVEG